MDVSYKFIPDEDVFEYIKVIKSWDKKRTFCSSYDDEDLFCMFSKNVGGFVGDKMVSYGQIQFLPTLERGFSLNLSYIVSPEYRRKGIGTESC